MNAPTWEEWRQLSEVEKSALEQQVYADLFRLCGWVAPPIGDTVLESEAAFDDTSLE